MTGSSIYIVPMHPRCGGGLVSLGMMQMLKTVFPKVAFFVPLLDHSENPWNEIDLIRERFSLDYPRDESYGLPLGTFESMLSNGEKNEALTKILEAYNRLKASHDVVLVKGFEPTASLSGVGGALQNELILNLEASPVFVYDARMNTVSDIVNEHLMETQRLSAVGITVLAGIVNRADPKESKAYDTHNGLYPIPYLEELDRISMEDLFLPLGCAQLFGSGEDVSRTVASKLIADMRSEHYLSHLKEKVLVIVPSDRSDILMASVLALYSKSYPHPAGILLTGGGAIDDNLRDLLNGLAHLSLPVLSTGLETYEAVEKIAAIRPKIHPGSERKIALALGWFNAYVPSDELLGKLEHPRRTIQTPAMFQYSVFHKAASMQRRVVLCESGDDRILRAAEIVLRRRIARITLLGNPTTIGQRAGILGLDLSQAQIADPASSELRNSFAEELYRLRAHKGLSAQIAHELIADPNYFGTMLVHMGHADAMVSGASHTTAETIRPALQIIKTRPGTAIVSSVFFMCMESEVLVYGDCAVVQNPDAEELAMIALSSAQTARSFGIDPKVAMLSYSTGLSGSGEEVEKVKTATERIRSIDPALAVEGPIQYDAAVDPDVASKKLPGSSVAGHANVFIFPDLNTGNNTYKAVQRSSGAIAVGPILQGLNKTVNDLSRGCTVDDIIMTVAMSAIQSGENR